MAYLAGPGSIGGERPATCLQVPVISGSSRYIRNHRMALHAVKIQFENCIQPANNLHTALLRRRAQN